MNSQATVLELAAEQDARQGRLQEDVVEDNRIRFCRQAHRRQLRIRVRIASITGCPHVHHFFWHT